MTASKTRTKAIATNNVGQNQWPRLEGRWQEQFSHWEASGPSRLCALWETLRLPPKV